ncbi:MAG TPA: acetylxylan esterase [Opitutus sp.]|nr:acetylxylan esterase [Opitutus sp.]
MRLCSLPTFLTVALAAAAICPGQQMTLAPDQPAGVYRVGDTVHWTAHWNGTGAPPAATYTLLDGGATNVASGSLAFTDNVATFDSSFTAPNTVLAKVAWSPVSSANVVTAGAVAAPAQIQPAAPPPDDFDAFWAGQLAALAAVPINPQLESVASGQSGVSYWKVTLDNIRGTHVQGQLARPATGDKFPALLILQWAGVYGLQKSWVTGYAAGGWLTFDIEAHDLPIDQPDSYYAAQQAGALANYWAIGNDDPDTSYYLRMYLSCYRAVDYLKTRADWDGRTIVVTGGSQGGQQTLVLAGLRSDITAALALVPAACDMLAPDVGRASGFPNWYYQTSGKDPAKVRAASRYYDPANFARHIACPVLIGLGLRDDVAPPSSILATASQIGPPKELVILPTAGHNDENGSQSAYNNRVYGAWLPALLQGRAPPAGGPIFSTQPANSAAAAGDAITLAASVSNPDAIYQWRLNGQPLSDATASSLAFTAAPAAAGLYTAVANDNLGATESAPAIVGPASSAKVIGDATEIAADIHHPNGNIYDQVLLQGAATTVTADPGQVVRTSFLDLNDNIVQVEFAGAGALTITLDDTSAAAPPLNYNQPDVSYAKGHAHLVITGANETTNVSVFAVGRITAINQGLFTNHPAAHTGATIASIAILSANGKFGGVRTANAFYTGNAGLVGLYAPGVEFVGPVYLGEIRADGAATPTLTLGAADTTTAITGGTLQQANNRPVQVDGLATLHFLDGTSADGDLEPAQPCAARLQQDGTDVTAQIVDAPGT